MGLKKVINKEFYCKVMKHFLIFILSFVFPSVVSATDGNHYNYAPKSPEAAAFDRVPDIPVSSYTGALSLTIPIYTVTCGDIVLPISLDYQGTAIPVRQEATWVGLNWLLELSLQESAETASMMAAYTTKRIGKIYQRD